MTWSSNDDSTLDATAFEDIYRDYAERMYRFCLVQTRNPALAEDIAAEAFVLAYAAFRKRPPDPEGVRPWLFRIATNLVTDHRRRERRRDRVMQVLGRSDARVESVEEIAATNAELARVLRVLAVMKDRDRKLIALRSAGKLSYREVGIQLGISETAAKLAAYRAFERFRRLSEQSP